MHSQLCGRGSRRGSAAAAAARTGTAADSWSGGRFSSPEQAAGTTKKGQLAAQKKTGRVPGRLLLSARWPLGDLQPGRAADPCR